ncbi:hypothetical protein K1T71_001320 [Dendrolimus kikuchii]|uniref:Uncharacterized protein n=1 Tax=Dendrolimus kikuchii TaxID=765133 RepID=A0ACC1DHA5_9NEOP|nr:hypothetical protein K1T71_001320 [Dendrolimus kikuchii]
MKNLKNRNIFLHVVATRSVSLLACIMVLPVIKYIKRKTTMIIGNVLCSSCFIIIAFVPEGKASVVLGCFGVLFCYMVFIVIYLYCTEMFSTVVRNSAVGISSMMARFGAMIAPFIADLKPYGKWCAPIAFGIFSLMTAVLCRFFPETKDCELLMTIEEGEALGTGVLQSQEPQFRN